MDRREKAFAVLPVRCVQPDPSACPRNLAAGGSARGAVVHETPNLEQFVGVFLDPGRSYPAPTIHSAAELRLTISPEPHAADNGSAPSTSAAAIRAGVPAYSRRVDVGLKKLGCLRCRVLLRVRGVGAARGAGPLQLPVVVLGDFPAGWLVFAGGLYSVVASAEAAEVRFFGQSVRKMGGVVDVGASGGLGAAGESAGAIACTDEIGECCG